MKYIVKVEEPPAFTEWKSLENPEWQPDWESIPGDVKRGIQASLLEEQGYICCYCSMGISDNDSHIEHLRPRGKQEYSHLELDYQNLLASCQLRLRPREPRHCGVLKEDWYDEDLMISPLSEDCEERFGFTADGDIYPVDGNDQAARETILELGLAIDKLRLFRKGAIEGVLDDLEILGQDEIQGLIITFRERDYTGKYTEFCTAIVHVLSELV